MLPAHLTLLKNLKEDSTDFHFDSTHNKFAKVPNFDDETSQLNL